MRTIYSIAILTSLGIVLSASTTQIASNTYSWYSMSFLNKHLAAVAVGCVICYMYQKSHRNFGLVFYVIGLLGCIYLLLFGRPIKGARRWIRFAGISVQPSEFMRFGCNLLIVERQYIALLPAIFVLILQPDVGSMITLVLITMSILWIQQISWQKMLLLIAGTICIGCISIVNLPHAKARLTRFMHNDPGYQLLKVRQAFSHISFFGAGLGEGALKYYTPDIHTDFVFALIAEELGVFGCLLVLLCFTHLLFIFLLYSHDQYIAVSCLSLLVQFFIHALSNLGLIPSKGFTLPFIGYGGSNMLVNMCYLGLILRRLPYAKQLQLK